MYVMIITLFKSSVGKDNTHIFRKWEIMTISLQEKLKSYGDTYWNFDKVRRNGIHKIVNYPAMMVAPMQHKLIEDIINMERNIKNIFDPFHGSGTTLVEGNRFGLNLLGIDINPLANLITKVKLYGVDKDKIYNSNEELFYNINRLKNSEIELHTFDKIKKWFREDIIRDLTIIRNSIILEKSQKNRLYYWLCLCDLIRKYSNTRSSTFKLHIKEEHKIKEMENNLINDFVTNVKTSHLFLEPEKSNYKSIIQGDSLVEMRKMGSESIDFICTSPPYGDNGTTVTYGQYSILCLLWIDVEDLTISNDLLISNFSAIDTLSLGGRIDPVVTNSNDIPSQTLKNTLNSISLIKQKKVKCFFNDYFKILLEMIRVLKSEHLMVLTLGNRRVDNQEIQLDEITKEFCTSNGLIVEAKLNREIPRKRMPKKISHIENYGPVQSMNSETVIVLRKRRVL